MLGSAGDSLFLRNVESSSPVEYEMSGTVVMFDWACSCVCLLPANECVGIICMIPRRGMGIYRHLQFTGWFHTLLLVGAAEGIINYLQLMGDKWTTLDGILWTCYGVYINHVYDKCN